MKMRLATGVAAVLAFGSIAVAEPAPAGRACREVSGGVPASPLASSYNTGQVRVDKQRGSSVCDGMNSGLYCVISDPGRFSVTSNGVSKTFALPLLAKARLKVRGGEIDCRVL
jgi:hypothetical protein